MKVHEIIKKCQDHGIEVEVKHHRYRDSRFHTVLPKGGITTVYLISDEDCPVIKGEAVCSEEDNYNKTIGVQIALGRALHNFFRDRFIVEEFLNS